MTLFISALDALLELIRMKTRLRPLAPCPVRMNPNDNRRGGFRRGVKS